MTDLDILRAFPTRTGDGMTASLMARNKRWLASDIEPALARLAKAGFIVFTGTSRDVAGNSETVYVITDEGRKATASCEAARVDGMEGRKMGFKKATKHQAYVRIGLVGPAGSGKTYTALRVAKGMAGDGKIAVIDTERGSASLYSGERGIEFDVMELDSYGAERFIGGINDAVAAGYKVLIIDSLSHAWAGKDGILEFVDKAGKRNQGGGNFGAWREATPRHNSLIDTILGAPIHIICTLRSKVEYVVENINGRNQVRKVGLQPVQRDGMEYEFTLVGDVSQEHDLVITKTRAAFLKDAVIREAGEELGQQIVAWLRDGYVETPRTYEVEERAAIMEHDGGVPREQAERIASNQPAAIATVNHGTIADYIASATAPRTLVKIRERVEALAAEGTLAEFERADLLEKIETAMDAMRQKEVVA
jgi:DNA-binding MarR family transcriptional regulator